MSVTVEQIEAVAKAIEDDDNFRDEDALESLKEYADRVRFRQELADSPHADLARQMFDRVKVRETTRFENVAPKNGRHWLQAAEAAHAILVPKPVPREFTKNDQEPADVRYLRDWEGDLFRYVGPDHWEYRRKDSGEWCRNLRFRWREVNSGAVATEDLEFTE